MKHIARRLSTATILFLGFVPWLVEISMRGMPRHEDRDRGDVPGWVMITLVTRL